MKNLLIGIFVLGCLATSASPLSSLMDSVEAKKCQKQLRKELNKSKKDLRYLYHLDSHPLIHVFAVYQEQKAEVVDVIKMVKHAGRKCERY